jgi:hypothetical protein
VAAKTLTDVDRAHLAIIALWLDSLRGWFALMAAEGNEPIAVDAAAPDWVRICASRLDRTLFAPANVALDAPVLTPYRAGYCLGLMRWGTNQLNIKVPREVRDAVKKIRLSKKARRQVVRLWQDFLISVQILVRKNGRVQTACQRELNQLVRLTKKYTGPDEWEFHRGLSSGLRGFGNGAPGDRSNHATDVYLALVVWWRFVVRFASVTVLHAWLTRLLGPARAGERKRTEKICERIGLKFRPRGRPRKNPTPALPA